MSSATPAPEKPCVFAPNQLHGYDHKFYFTQCPINKALKKLLIEFRKQCDVMCCHQSETATRLCFDNKPQAAKDGSVQPGAHIQFPPGLHHEHDCGQAPQDQH